VFKNESGLHPRIKGSEYNLLWQSEKYTVHGPVTRTMILQIDVMVVEFIFISILGLFDGEGKHVDHLYEKDGHVLPPPKKPKGDKATKAAKGKKKAKISATRSPVSISDSE